MNPSNKLADLRALASSAVAEESSKATSLLRKSPPSEAAQETGAGGGTKASKQSRKTIQPPMFHRSREYLQFCGELT